jgi:geranylgeranyl pyrophosphate synthase
MLVSSIILRPPWPPISPRKKPQDGAEASVLLVSIRFQGTRNFYLIRAVDLVRGEVLQIKDSRTGVADMEGYLRKNFYKTASLMANSCKSAALLGENVSPEVVDVAYTYGKHIGVAFQLIDDALDFEGSAASLGKPALADLNAGLSMAPLLFAAESHLQLIPAMARKFKERGDIELALGCIDETGGVN